MTNTEIETQAIKATIPNILKILKMHQNYFRKTNMFQKKCFVGTDYNVLQGLK